MTTPLFDCPRRLRPLQPSTAHLRSGIEAENDRFPNDGHESLTPASVAPSKGRPTSLGKSLEKIRLISSEKGGASTKALRPKTSSAKIASKMDKITSASVMKSSPTKSLTTRDVRLQDARHGVEVLTVVTDSAGKETQTMTHPTEYDSWKRKEDSTSLPPSPPPRLLRESHAKLPSPAGNSHSPRSQSALKGGSSRKSPSLTPSSRKKTSSQPKTTPSPKRSSATESSLSYYRKLSRV